MVVNSRRSHRIRASVARVILGVEASAGHARNPRHEQRPAEQHYRGLRQLAASRARYACHDVEVQVDI